MFRDREILSSCMWLIVLVGSTNRQSNLWYFCVYFTSCGRRVECRHGLHAKHPQFAVRQWDNCTAPGGQQSVRCAAVRCRCRCAIHTPVQYCRACSIRSKSGTSGCRHYGPNSLKKNIVRTYGPITATWCLIGTLLHNFTTPYQILPSTVVVCDAENREIK
jgi:hypothetical protein